MVIIVHLDVLPSCASGSFMTYSDLLVLGVESLSSCFGTADQYWAPGVQIVFATK